MSRLFFSYSHRDQALRDELEVHLAQLRNEGLIEAWHDRRIPAGDEFDDEISQHLEAADIVLLLVSPYFLASKYCYQIEMMRALKRHELKQARVIPVILHPCDWKTAPFAKLQAATKDGVPVSKYPNMHDAFLEIALAIRQVAAPAESGYRRTATSNPRAATPAASHPRSSNLRVKKQFTDQERDAFLEESFEYVANFFEGSLAELQVRNPEISGRFRRVTANHFTAVIYRAGEKLNACGIRLSETFGSKQISFSFEPESTNSMNEGVSVDDDGHTLFLKPSGLSTFGGGSGKEQTTREGASELFWSLLIRPLQQ